MTIESEYPGWKTDYEASEVHPPDNDGPVAYWWEDMRPAEVQRLAIDMFERGVKHGLAQQVKVTTETIAWDFNGVNQLEARPSCARLVVTDWDENSARCKLLSTRHGGEWLVASITVHARHITEAGGGGVLCEAQAVMSGLYWSWRRSSGPGGGADDAPPEWPLPRGDYKGRLRHG